MSVIPALVFRETEIVILNLIIYPETSLLFSQDSRMLEN